MHCYNHHAIQSSCATGWLVIHQNRGQAVRLCNGLIDPGQLYIGAESRLSGCATGKLILAGYTSGQSPGCPVVQQAKQVDPGQSYIKVESRLSGCATGLVNSD